MNQQHYYKAKRRVRKIKYFYFNLITWLVVSIVLLIIWGNSNVEFFWPVFPIAGWGLGVLFQGFNVFGFGNDWEERKILEEMQRLEEAEAAQRRLQGHYQNTENTPDRPLEGGEELDLKEFKELRKEWDDQEFV